MTHSLNCAAQCSLHNLAPMEPHPEQAIWLAEIKMATQERLGLPPVMTHQMYTYTPTIPSETKLRN